MSERSSGNFRFTKQEMKLTGRAVISRTSPRERRAGSSDLLASILLLAALLVIAEMDRLTGTFPIQHLYYLPIVLAAIRFKKMGGLLAACLSVILHHLTNQNLRQWQYGELGLMQLIIFIGVGLITAKLADDAARMRLLAHTDDLTGLHNLRSFEARYAILTANAVKNQTLLALLVLDLDRLNTLNGRYGHLAGAEAIQSLGWIIAEETTPESVACRYGGDEFVIAIPVCTVEQAFSTAERIWSSLARLSPNLAGHALPAGTLTTSVGVSTILPALDDDPLSIGEQLFRDADRALYRAKDLGRNRICCFPPAMGAEVPSHETFPMQPIENPTPAESSHIGGLAHAGVYADPVESSGQDLRLEDDLDLC